jgi:hypothetical protein
MDEASKPPTQDDFSAAFTELMGAPAEEAPEDKTVETPVEGEEKPKDDEGEAEKPKDGEEEKPVDKPVEKTQEELDAEQKVIDDAEAELAKDETPEQTTARHTKEAEEAEATKKAEEEAAAAATPTFATKQDIKDALSERETESSQRVTKLNQGKKEVIDKLYPEGIDQSIYDDNGKVVKTAQDIVDRGLINRETGEPFNYDEAASFMLKAQQQSAANVKELEDYAEGVAEKNINLLEGNQRVIAKWGDTFKTMPKETVENLAAEYVRTQLKFDKTNSYMTEMNMTPEDFYAIVMSPYSNLKTSVDKETAAATKKAEADAAAAKKAEDDAKIAEQEERNGGFPQRGSSKTKSNTGDVNLDALVDALNE